MDDEKYKLKSCPFCGSEGKLNYSVALDDYVVECVNDFCMASYIIGMKYDTEDEAITAWNRRFT